jgi:hypothetical protein
MGLGDYGEENWQEKIDRWKKEREERLAGASAAAPKPQTPWAPSAAGAAQEQGYVDQAVGAGQKLGQEYLTGQERLGQSMQEQGTAMQRMAARSLMGATPFGAPGGAAVMPAAATALQAQERVAGMERTGIGQMTDLGALGQQATQAGAEYGLSAMAGPRQQQKKLGYMQYYFDARKSLSKADADALLANLLMNETDPTVVTEMQSFIQTSE